MLVNSFLSQTRANEHCHHNNDDSISSPRQKNAIPTEFRSGRSSFRSSEREEQPQTSGLAADGFGRNGFVPVPVKQSVTSVVPDTVGARTRTLTPGLLHPGLELVKLKPTQTIAPKTTHNAPTTTDVGTTSINRGEGKHVAKGYLQTAHKSEPPSTGQSLLHGTSNSFPQGPVGHCTTVRR